MWSIKFLSGPKAGKEIFLQLGMVVLGRDNSCQISISSSGISKKHAQIFVKDTGLIIEDLDSRNGTFIKGKQIKSHELKAGDRVALYDVIFEVKKKTSQQAFPMYGMPYVQNAPNSSLLNQDPSLLDSLNQNAESSEQKNLIDAKGSLVENVKKSVTSYLDNAVLPGVYKLAEWTEFRFVVGCFVIGFIVMVTVFSFFPLVAILKSTVEQESRNHAESIATTVALVNRDVLKKGLQTATTVDYALKRPGVKKALIISAIDGRVLAPAELAHTYPKSSLIHKARKKNQITVEKMDSSSMAAIVPIRFFNPETGENTPRAYSVVIYDMDSLFIGSKQVVSLLVRVLIFSSLIGFILFFFLISLIEFPVKSINRQLGRALKDEKSPSISINYQSQILAELCSHINSALNQISLNKMLNQKKDEDEGGEISRQDEMNNLVEIIGFPSISVNMEEETVASLNSNFTDQIGFSEILHQPLSAISDSNLRDHLLNLLEQGKTNSQEIAFGEINLNQMNLQSTCLFVMGKSSPAYAIVTFMPLEAEEGVA